MIISRFFLLSTILMLILLGIGYGIWAAGPDSFDFSAVFIAVFISFITALIAYVLTYYGIKSGTRQFATLLIMGMFAKMAVGIAATVVVALRFEPYLKEFVFAYFIGYFVFTAFEVYGLMRKLRA